jgi:hypothetical protein
MVSLCKKETFINYVLYWGILFVSIIQWGRIIMIIEKYNLEMNTYRGVSFKIFKLWENNIIDFQNSFSKCLAFLFKCLYCFYYFIKIKFNFKSFRTLNKFYLKRKIKILFRTPFISPSLRYISSSYEFIKFIFFNYNNNSKTINLIYLTI